MHNRYPLTVKMNLCVSFGICENIMVLCNILNKQYSDLFELCRVLIIFFINNFSKIKKKFLALNMDRYLNGHSLTLLAIDVDYKNYRFVRAATTCVALRYRLDISFVFPRNNWDVDTA